MSNHFSAANLKHPGDDARLDRRVAGGSLIRRPSPTDPMAGASPRGRRPFAASGRNSHARSYGR